MFTVGDEGLLPRKKANFLMGRRLLGKMVREAPEQPEIHVGLRGHVCGLLCGVPHSVLLQELLLLVAPFKL